MLQNWSQIGGFQSKRFVAGGVDSVGSGYGPVAVSYQYGDEPSGSGATGVSYIKE
jgi:hypothetical protein